jgi:uncharacterized Zn finger protein
VRAERAFETLSKKGGEVAPIIIEGRKIAHTFWGKAWCENLERYSDYANRLPRGRSYVRHRAVLDLKIEPQVVRALVQGTRLYKVEARIRAITRPRWQSVVGACSGSIDSLVELLEGKLSERVMSVVTKPGEGLFPTPEEIDLHCSCPDWATMCKHVAAVLYGVGARLDHEPALLFRLRGVDPAELTQSREATSLLTDSSRVRRERRLDAGDLSEVFGIAIDTAGEDRATRVQAKQAGGESGDEDSPRGFARGTRSPLEHSEHLPRFREGAGTLDAKRPGNVASPKRSRSTARAAEEDPPRPRKRGPVMKVSAPAAKKSGGGTLGKDQLLALGIKPATIKTWLARGVLRETRDPDSYATTRETARLVLEHRTRRNR